MNVALYPGTLGYFLRTMIGEVADDATLDQLRVLVTRSVTGRGPLPALRVGNQPYGIVLAGPPPRRGAAAGQGALDRRRGGAGRGAGPRLVDPVGAAAGPARRDRQRVGRPAVGARPAADGRRLLPADRGQLRPPVQPGGAAGRRRPDGRRLRVGLRRHRDQLDARPARLVAAPARRLAEALPAAAAAGAPEAADPHPAAVAHRRAAVLGDRHRQALRRGEDEELHRLAGRQRAQRRRPAQPGLRGSAQADRAALPAAAARPAGAGRDQRQPVVQALRRRRARAGDQPQAARHDAVARRRRVGDPLDAGGRGARHRGDRPAAAGRGAAARVHDRRVSRTSGRRWTRCWRRTACCAACPPRASSGSSPSTSTP